VAETHQGANSTFKKKLFLSPQINFWQKPCTLQIKFNKPIESDKESKMSIFFSGKRIKLNLASPLPAQNNFKISSHLNNF
jgi:hypothetical protein